MLKSLLAFECRYQTKQTVFKLSLFAFAFFTFFVPRNFGGPGLTVHAPFAVIMLLSLASLGAVFMLSLFAGNAVVRDRERGMEAIIHTTSVSRFDYLMSRFGGMWGAAVLVMIGACIAAILGGVVRQSLNGDPLQLSGYGFALLVMVVPNLFFSAVLLFAVSVYTRQTLAVYIAGLAIYILYMVGSMWGNSPLMAQSGPLTPDQSLFASLADPFGIIAFLEQTRFWTMAQKNADLPSLSGNLLFNRLFWGAFSLFLLAMVNHFHSFSFRFQSPSKRRQTLADAVPVVSYEPAPVVEKDRTYQFVSWYRQTLVEFRLLMKSMPMVAFGVLWVFFIAVTLFDEVRDGELGVPVVPSPPTFISTIHVMLVKLGLLSVIYFTAEVFHRERECGASPLLWSTPITGGAAYFAKLGALAGYILSLIGVSCGMAMIMTPLLGGSVAGPVAFLPLVFTAGVPLLLYAVLALFLFGLVKNKYAGLFLAVLPFILPGVVSRLLKTAHPLLAFPSLPIYEVSTMTSGGYGLNERLWLSLFWAALLVLPLLAGLWQRRLHHLRPHGAMKNLTFAFAVSALLVAAGLGFWIHRSLPTSMKSFGNQGELERVEYEKAYRSWLEANQPHITNVDLKVDLFPDQDRLRISGSYELTNKGTEPISQCLLSMDMRAQGTYRLELEGGYVVEDRGLMDTKLYQFDSPMPVGGSGTLHFEIELRFNRYQLLDSELYVLPEASYLEVDKALPFFGYDSGRELSNPASRRENGLGPKVRGEKPNFAAVVDDQRLDWRAEVTTKAGQEIVGLGELVDSGEREGRVFAVYQARNFDFAFPFSSGTYETVEETHNGVVLQIKHAPGHGFNAERILRAAKASLDYFGNAFSPYPHDVLRIVEISSFSGRFGGTSYPTTIFAVEDRFFLLNQDRNPGFDIVSSLTAHEIAHQWWGHLLDPAMEPGARLLTETLAEYSELVVGEQLAGENHINHYLDKALHLYYNNRGFDPEPEPTLDAVTFDPYVYYFKGAHVMHSLRRQLGEDRINQALRAMLEKYPYPNRPTSHALLAELRAVTPDNLQDVLTTLFSTVTTYRVQLVEAVKDESGVEVHLKLRKEVLNPKGEAVVDETPETYEFVFYDAQGRTEVVERTLTSGSRRIRFDLGLDPVRVGFDPRRLKLQDEEPGVLEITSGTQRFAQTN